MEDSSCCWGNIYERLLENFIYYTILSIEFSLGTKLHRRDFFWDAYSTVIYICNQIGNQELTSFTVNLSTGSSLGRFPRAYSLLSMRFTPLELPKPEIVTVII